MSLSAKKLFKITSWTKALVSLFPLALLINTKGLNHTMNLVNYLVNLPASDLATLLLLAFLTIVMLILAALALTFVKSLIAGKTSKINSTLFLQSLDSCLTMILQRLKKPLNQETPTSSSQSTLESSQTQQETKNPSLLQLLEKALDFLKENENEKH